MTDASAVLSYYQERTEQMLTLLGELMQRESPSTDKEAVDHACDWLETELAVLPVEVERLGRSSCGDALRVRREADEETKGKQILLLTHTDTVWPAGELERRPFGVDGNRVTGPGCLDNKSGQVLLLTLLQGIRDMEISLGRPITALLNGDEEIGSVATRQLIEEEIGRSDFVLCLEAGKPEGALITSRKAVGRFTMVITGKASHAGAAPDQGVSAIEELAEQVREIHALNDMKRGINVNVGVVSGGERANMVAGKARAEIDLRAGTAEEGEAVARKIMKAKPHREGIHIEVTGGMTRPAWKRTEATGKLFEIARSEGGKLGLDIIEAGSGGGSDASFAAKMGVPVLDGLGGVGDWAHSEEEYLLVSSLAERAALLTLVVAHLANEGM